MQKKKAEKCEKQKKSGMKRNPKKRWVEVKMKRNMEE